MGWQNVFAAVFQAGNTVIINGSGQFVYKGPPAAGNLIFTVVPSTNPLPTTDPYGNQVFPFETVYSAAGPASPNVALNFNPVTGINTFFNPSGQGSGYTLVNNLRFFEPPGDPNGGFWLNPGRLYLQEVDPTTIVNHGAADLLFPDLNGRPAWFTSNNPVTNIWTLDRSLTDPGTVTVPGTSTIPSNMTMQYPVDPANGLVPGSVYTLKTWFTSAWNAQNLNIFVNLNGTTTLLAIIGATFTPGIIAGQNTFGWIELEVLVISSTQVRVSLGGVITIGLTQTNTSSCSFTSGVLTQAFTGGNIGLACDWTASGGGNLVTSGSRFTRRG